MGILSFLDLEVGIFSCLLLNSLLISGTRLLQCLEILENPCEEGENEIYAKGG